MPVDLFSLYVHIPFCIRKCSYCDFYSIPYTKELSDKLLWAIQKEFELRVIENHLEKAEVDTVFYGGGTPSILSLDQWEKHLREMNRSIQRTENCEWTAECNPDSFSSLKADMWIAYGVNRLTLGMQSLDEGLLKKLGRPHTAQRTAEVLADSSLEKFKSVGIDLMYALPEQDSALFRETLKEALSIPFVKHLSVYELDIHPDTEFGRNRSRLNLPDETVCIAMDDLLLKETKHAGFHRYEISNFARQGFECRHNKCYWEHKPYIGLGPAAHSFVNSTRWANVADVDEYISLVEDGKLPTASQEILSQKDIANEMLFLRLRTSEGLNEISFEEKTGILFYDGVRKPMIASFLDKGCIVFENPWWRLTEKGMRIADAIARKLMTSDA